MRRLWICLIPLFAAGCFSSSIEREFPKEIEGTCWHALNESKKGIESVGTTLNPEWDLKVVTVKGEKEYSAGWAWDDPQLGWIYGYCSGGFIQIAANPNNSADINYNVLFHECGHYWLISNYGIRNHPAQYDPIFSWSWIDNRGIESQDDMTVDYVSAEEL